MRLGAREFRAGHARSLLEPKGYDTVANVIWITEKWRPMGDFAKYSWSNDTTFVVKLTIFVQITDSA
jgi:hypothetical protein